MESRPLLPSDPAFGLIRFVPPGETVLQKEQCTPPATQDPTESVTITAQPEAKREKVKDKQKTREEKPAVKDAPGTREVPLRQEKVGSRSPRRFLHEPPYALLL